MGCIDGKHIKEFNVGRNVGASRHEIAFEVNDWDCDPRHTFRFVTNGKRVSKQKAHTEQKMAPYELSEYDRFEIRIDFNTNECRAFMNGVEVDMCITDLPPTMYLAASVNQHCECAIETTLFECTKRTTS